MTLDPLIAAFTGARIPSHDEILRQYQADSPLGRYKLQPGEYFHGMVEPLEGDQIDRFKTPKHRGPVQSHNYMTDSVKVARDFADSRGKGPGSVHIVRPTGQVERDNEEESSWKSPDPLQITQTFPYDLKADHDYAHQVWLQHLDRASRDYVERQEGQQHQAAKEEPLPFMRQPSEEELAEHLEKRHGMDRERQALYGFPGHWRRWHNGEHHIYPQTPLGRQTRSDFGPDHQHTTPRGEPLEEEYSPAFEIADDASDVMGISGGRQTHTWESQVPKTGPFYPTDLTHYSALIEHPFPNPYHGNPMFGGNPEFSHTWFHGTRGQPDFGERQHHYSDEQDYAKPPEERLKGHGWTQPNQHMGIHFSPLHEVGHKFAPSVQSNPTAIVHARLNLHNPAHFPTEKHLNYAVAHWASQHYPHWHSEKVNDQLGWQYSDREGTRRDFTQVPSDPYASDRAQDVLQWHPHLPEIIRGFHQHLRDNGHHGITYGNMVEGPYSTDATRGGQASMKYIEKTQDFPRSSPRHISAIVQPEDIQTTHVEHIAPWREEPEPHQKTWEQASALDEGDEMRDRVLAYHREHGGAYPSRMPHEAAFEDASDEARARRFERAHQWADRGPNDSSRSFPHKWGPTVSNQVIHGIIHEHNGGAPIDEEHWTHLPEEDVNIRQPIYSHQGQAYPEVLHSKLHSLESEPDFAEDEERWEETGEPKFVRHEGRTYLLDGHHRFARNRLMGKSTMRGRVFDTSRPADRMENCPECSEPDEEGDSAWSMHKETWDRFHIGAKHPSRTKAEVNYRPANGARRCGNCIMLSGLNPPDFESGKCDFGFLAEVDHTCDKWEADTRSRRKKGAWYHGTSERFKPGDELTPEGSWATDRASRPGHVYFTDSVQAAERYANDDAEMARRRRGYVYEVEPTGHHEEDPEEGPGNRRTSHPVRVVRKLSAFDWGEGYTTCDQGHEHWGRHGAAGLLVRHKGDDGQTRYLLQQRAEHVHHGGTWSTPGGAMHKGEQPEAAARREAEEELGDLPGDLTHHHTVTDDHGGWAYHTVVMDSPKHFMPGGNGETDWESSGHGWFTGDEAKKLRLHPGFAKTWDVVRRSRVDKQAARRGYFHGTAAELEPGDHVVPGQERGSAGDKAFFTRKRGDAGYYALQEGNLRTPGSPGHVYRVRPLADRSEFNDGRQEGEYYIHGHLKVLGEEPFEEWGPEVYGQPLKLKDRRWTYHQASLMYHWSPARNRTSIEERGLFPRHPETGESIAERDLLPAGVYMFHDRKDAEELGEGAGGDVYEVDTHGLGLHPDPTWGRASYSSAAIEPGRIHRSRTDKTAHVKRDYSDRDDPESHNYDWCWACKTHHGDEWGGRDTGHALAEEHEGSWTDWRHEYKHLPARMHRGMAIELPPDIHDYVHDPKHPASDRAATLMGHIGQNNLGTHWGTNEPKAREYATQNSWYKGGGMYGKPGSRYTEVVMHADKPRLKHIERDPDTLTDGRVLSYDSHEDSEIPMQDWAPVRVRGISWREPNHREGIVGVEPTPWNHHEFRPAREHQAAISGHGMDPFSMAMHGLSGEDAEDMRDVIEHIRQRKGPGVPINQRDADLMRRSFRGRDRMEQAGFTISPHNQESKYPRGVSVELQHNHRLGLVPERHGDETNWYARISHNEFPMAPKLEYTIRASDEELPQAVHRFLGDPTREGEMRHQREEGRRIHEEIRREGAARRYAPGVQSSLAARGYELAPRSGMISLDIPEEVSRAIAFPGGVTDHHITLVYLGKDVDDQAFAHACQEAKRLARMQKGPMPVLLRGLDSFEPSQSSDFRRPYYVPAQLPGNGHQLRRELEHLSASEHKDWVPHITLAYCGEGEKAPQPVPAVRVRIPAISVHRGDEVVHFPFWSTS